MNINHHIYFSGVLILLSFLNPWFVISAIASILIDADHALYYFVKFKTLDLKKAYNYFYGTHRKEAKFVFHTIWFLMFLFFLYAVTPFPINKIILFTAFGLMYHFFFDIIFDVFRLSPKTFEWLNRLFNLKLSDKIKVTPRQFVSNITQKFIGIRV